MSRSFRFVVLASCLVILSGCTEKKSTNEDRTQAKGIVTLDGQPLTGGGTIKFQSIENSRIRVLANIDAAGNFLVGDAPSGPMKMAVTTSPKLYPEQTPIPQMYANLRTSGLEGEITSGDESFEVRLKSKR